ncbi:MAG: hypothetical protein RL681_520 [Candidatus Parcubacteria bacterium]
MEKVFRKLGLPAAIIAVAYANRTRSSASRLVELIVERANEWGQQLALPVGGWLLFLAVLSGVNASMELRLVVWSLPFWVLVVALAMRLAAIPVIWTIQRSGNEGRDLVQTAGHTVGWVLATGWLIMRLPINNYPWAILFVPPLMAAVWLITMGQERWWFPKIKRAIILGVTVDAAWMLAKVIFGTVVLEQWTPPFWVVAVAIIAAALLTDRTKSPASLVSAPAKSTPAASQTTAKSGGWLKTILVLAAIGVGIWFIGKPIFDREMAKEAAKEERKKPVTLACDPTRYNTTLLAGRERNEWAIANVDPGCEATEKVAIPLDRRQIRTDSMTDIEMRLYGPNNGIIFMDGTDPDGWFTDSPTMRIDAPNAIAIQLRNRSTATKSTKLASS